MSEPKFKVGDIVRYDNGPSALFKIKEVYENYGGEGYHRYYGRQYYGDIMGQYENQIRPASNEDVQKFKTDTHIGRLRDYPELAE